MDYWPNLQVGCKQNCSSDCSCNPFFSKPNHPHRLDRYASSRLRGRGLTFAPVHVLLRLCDSEAHAGWSVNHLWRPLPLLICILQQLYQPSALINACLLDTVWNLPRTLLCAYVYLPVSPWLIGSRGCSADMTAQRRTGQVTAGQRRPGNKSVIFQPLHKQVIILRWAIAYYGLHPACDISKHRRTAPCECLGLTNGECVLTSWRGLMGVWTSSSHGDPGRLRTCYEWVWEQTGV